MIRPGKLYERSRSCLITANGRGIRVKDFQVATGIKGMITGEYGWFTPEEITAGIVPVNVREGLPVNGEIYVCRAKIGNNGDFHPGKTNEDFETCSIGYGHKAREEPTHQILACVE